MVLRLTPVNESVRHVEELEAIGDEGQLDDELDKDVLLRHHVTTEQRRPLLYVLLLKLNEKQLSCR